MSMLTLLARRTLDIGLLAKRQAMLFMKELLLFITGSCLPRHGKRILCLMTVYRHLADEHLLREVSLKELNATMDLADNENALRVPEMWYSRLWNSEEIRDTAKSAGILHPSAPNGNMDVCMRGFCQQLAQVSPPYLRYAPDDVIADDIQKLVTTMGSRPFHLV